MKVVVMAGNRVAANYVGAGICQTYVQEAVCQIFHKGKMHHLPCGSPSLGGIRLKGLGGML